MPEFEYDCKQNKMDEKIFKRGLAADNIIDLPYRFIAMIGEVGIEDNSFKISCYKACQSNGAVFPVYIRLKILAKQRSH